jgi:hypothetical protein
MNKEDLTPDEKFALELGKLCHARTDISIINIIAQLEVMKFVLIDSMICNAKEIAMTNLIARDGETIQ